MNKLERGMRVFADILAVPAAALILIGALGLPESLQWLGFAAAVLAAIRGFLRVGNDFPKAEMFAGLVAGNRLIDVMFDCVIATFGAYALFSVLAVRAVEDPVFYWSLQSVALIVPITLIAFGLKRFAQDKGSPNA